VADQVEGDTKGLLGWLGKNRDGLIVVGVIVYVLGYLVWSLNALQNQLGLLPAIQSQYLLAGTIPFLVFWSFYLFVKNSERISQSLRGALSSGQIGFMRILRYLVIFQFFVIVGTYLLTVDWSAALKSAYRPIWREQPITILSLWLVYPSMYFFSHCFTTRQAITNKIVYLFNYLYIAIFAIYAVALYSYWIYPTLPQELGGVKPRCAHIDILKDKISADLFSKLVLNENYSTASAVKSTIAVNVFFSNDSGFIVKPLASGSKGTIELSRNTVSALVSCD
jgi:hypothetical protein